MRALPDFSDRYTALILRTGLGHDWKRTILWFLTHSIFVSTWIIFAGLAQYIPYDPWTYIWFSAWIFLVLLMRRTTHGLNELVGVPLENSRLYDSNIYNRQNDDDFGQLKDGNLSNTANQFLHQPLELVLGFGAYILFAIFFIPWSYQGGIFGEHPYPWEDLVLITNLIFFFVDFLHFGSACFVFLGLFVSLYNANFDAEIESNKSIIKIEKNGEESEGIEDIVLEYPMKIRRYGHIVADVTLGALGLILLLQLHWLVDNTLKGLEVGWSGPLLHIPLFIGALLAFLLPQKKLHDTLCQYWEPIRKTHKKLYNHLGPETCTTVLENTRRYKFGILIIFVIGCLMMDYHMFQLMGFEIWTVITIQMAVMGGLIQGWQFIE